jgi:UDP-glucose 4-epimerase
MANKFKKKILIASSSEIYGKSERVPFAEDDDIVLGSTIYSRWSYACSKAIDEFLGLAFHQQYGLPVVIARFFNTSAPPNRPVWYGRAAICPAPANKPITIYGNGKQSRCFFLSRMFSMR